MSLHTLPSSLALCLPFNWPVSPFIPFFASAACEHFRRCQHNDSHSYHSCISPSTRRTSFYSPAHTRHPPVCVPVRLCVCRVTFSCRKLVLPPLPPCPHSQRKIWVWLLAWPLFYWACASHGLDKCPAAWEAWCSSAVLYRCITHPVSHPFLKSFSLYSASWLMVFRWGGLRWQDSAFHFYMNASAWIKLLLQFCHGHGIENQARLKQGGCKALALFSRVDNMILIFDPCAVMLLRKDQICWVKSILIMAAYFWALCQYYST